MNEICGCGKVAYAKGVCRACYDRERQRKRRLDPLEREKDAAAAKVYRDRNRAEVLARRKLYRSRNRQSLSAKRKQYYSVNKVRAAETRRTWTAKNSVKAKALKQKWLASDRGLAWQREYALKYRARNIQKVLQNEQRYRDCNREACRDRLRAVHAHRRSAVVSWADQNEIKRIYREARCKSVVEGLAYEVDHVIPLKGKTVSGLHVEYNLRIVPKKINRRKGNRLLDY